MVSEADRIKLAGVAALWAEMPREDQEATVERWYTKLRTRCVEIGMSGGSMEPDEWDRWNAEMRAIKEGLAHAGN